MYSEPYRVTIQVAILTPKPLRQNFANIHSFSIHLNAHITNLTAILSAI